MMTGRERVLAVLNHETPDKVPYQPLFMDPVTESALMSSHLETVDWGVTFPGLMVADPEAKVRLLRFMDADIAWANNPLRIQAEIVSEDERAYTQVWENGLVARVHKNPYFWEPADFPIKGEGDLDKMVYPDLEDPSRRAGLREEVTFLKAQGYFIVGFIGYYLYQEYERWRAFEEFLIDLLKRKAFAHEMLKRTAEFHMRQAEIYIEAGVDCIAFADDLGHGQGLIFSPATLEEFAFPLYSQMVDLCHRYGVYVDFHSHGNINRLMDRIVEIGVDILNPVEPADGMVLSELKARYGDKLTFRGGISKYIGQMSQSEIEAHFDEVLRVGSRGGRFILAEGGGIPQLSQEMFGTYRQLMRKYREKYGHRV